MSKQGIETGRFGKWLYEYCEREQLPVQVYYDHGDKEKDPHVGATQGFYGEKPSNLTNLVEVDIIIGSDNDEVLLLIEIEEHSVSPKKILGEALAIMMCNGFAVKVEGTHKIFYPSKNTDLYIACWFNPRGKGKEKISNLNQRFKEIEGFKDGILNEKIMFIMEDDPDIMIKELKKKVISSLKG